MSIMTDKRGDMTYQSVRSIATYIAPMANMTWNQAYYRIRCHHILLRKSYECTYVVASSRALVITGLSRDFILIIILELLVKG